MSKKLPVSVEALRNDYAELLRSFNPSYVTISLKPKAETPAGMMCVILVTVKAPTYYLEGEKDRTPKPIGGLTFGIFVAEGYPKVKPTVRYIGSKRLASVNVFPNGVQCTDQWSEGCSLYTLAKKTISDIVHESIVSRTESRATPDKALTDWQTSLKGASVPMSKILISSPAFKRAPAKRPPALPPRS